MEEEQNVERGQPGAGPDFLAGAVDLFRAHVLHRNGPVHRKAALRGKRPCEKGAAEEYRGGETGEPAGATIDA